MTPVGGGLQVPPDAQVMDLVFSDTGDLHGGFYDNNGGLDYHIVCTGGTGQSPLLKIVHVTVEMAPIAKVSRSWTVGISKYPGSVPRPPPEGGNHWWPSLLADIRCSRPCLEVHACLRNTLTLQVSSRGSAD